MAQSLADLVANIDPVLLEEVIEQYARREVGLSKGAALLNLHVTDFQALVGGRGIELAYSVEDLADDIETLKRLGHLRDLL